MTDLTPPPPTIYNNPVNTDQYQHLTNEKQKQMKL